MWNPWKNLHENFHERINEMQKSRGLRMWILHILDEHGPKNGVEIMDGVESHFETLHHFKYGSHKRSRRPSPGSIYPMLKKMVDENLIIKREDGRYELTKKGQEIVFKIFGHLHGRYSKNMDIGAFAIENALTEIDGYITNFENIKKEKLVPHEELIGNLSERLKNIQESLHME